MSEASSRKSFAFSSPDATTATVQLPTFGRAVVTGTPDTSWVARRHGTRRLPTRRYIPVRPRDGRGFSPLKGMFVYVLRSGGTPNPPFDSESLQARSNGNRQACGAIS